MATLLCYSYPSHVIFCDMKVFTSFWISAYSPLTLKQGQWCNRKKLALGKLLRAPTLLRPWRSSQRFSRDKSFCITWSENYDSGSNATNSQRPPVSLLHHRAGHSYSGLWGCHKKPKRAIKMPSVQQRNGWLGATPILSGACSLSSE